MNQKNIITIIASSIIALIILAGIVVVNIWGFNKELRFAQSQIISINVEQKADIKQIKEIANEVLGMHNMVQTKEIYEEIVAIRAKSISEGQKNDIVNKVKEIYEIQQTAETTKIDTIPLTRIRDMYKTYVLPFAISIIVVAIYMVIRYLKKGIWKVLARTIFVPAIVEALLLSWMAIVRIPIGRFTPVLVILAYVASILYVIKKCEE